MPSSFLKRFAAPCAALLLVANAPSAHAAACQCTFNGSAIAAAIQAVRAVNATGFAAVTLALDTLIETIHEEGSLTRGTMEKNHVAFQQLMDFVVAEDQRSALQREVAGADTQALRGTVLSIPKNACSRARAAQGAGIGLGTMSSAGSVYQQRMRDRLNGMRNPASEVKRINDLPDADRVPEFMGSSAGTMSEEQVDSYLNYLSVILPTPPNTPTAIPAAMRGTPASLAYEQSFKKYESEALLYNKVLTRDIVLKTPMAQVQPEDELVWEHVRSGVPVASRQLATPDGQPSTFPDHWGGLNVVNLQGRRMISELDYIRTAIFKRYANPKYQDDESYGLASKGTTETLMKEYLDMAAVQNRMLYEVMNSLLHQKQLLAIDAAANQADREQQGLTDLYIEATVN